MINLSNMPQEYVSTLEYDVVTELAWENGQLAMHGLGGPRVANINTANAPSSPATWEKPSSGGTLESIVNQATCRPLHPPNNFLSCFQQQRATMPMDALVPRQNKNYNNFGGSHEHDVLEECSARVGSCSAANGGCDGGESRKITLDTWEREFGGPEFLSQENNTISGQECTKTSADSISHHTRSQASDDQIIKEDDEVQVGKKRRKGKSSVSTKSNKRSRDSEVHNQSERNRRERINERMRILQKMVPRSSKTDKASMLDEVIEYMKQLQAQVSMMSMALNLPSMINLPMQQQLQMSMMAMGMSMGYCPAATGDCPRPPPIMPRPPLLACQSQAITMDAYNRLAAMYQQSQHQLHQQRQQQQQQQHQQRQQYKPAS